MMTLRCTQKLLARLGGGRHSDITEEPTTTLGDWHATLLFTRPAQLILCVNDRSRLPVLVPAKGAEAFPLRFQARLATLLARIGISPAAVAWETGEMRELDIAKTRDRSVLGSINDFRFAYEYAQHLRRAWDLDEWSWHLSQTPCGPLNYAYPSDVVIKSFEAARRRAVPEDRR